MWRGVEGKGVWGFGGRRDVGGLWEKRVVGGEKVGSGSWERGEMEEVVRRQIEVRGEKGVTGEKVEDGKRWGERTRW